jgi:hypothetical protein
MRNKVAPTTGPITNARGTVFFLGAALSGWMLCDVAFDAPDHPLLLIKYSLFAVAVIVTLYSGAKWFVMK